MSRTPDRGGDIIDYFGELTINTADHIRTKIFCTVFYICLKVNAFYLNVCKSKLYIVKRTGGVTLGDIDSR